MLDKLHTIRTGYCTSDSCVTCTSMSTSTGMLRKSSSRFEACLTDVKLKRTILCIVTVSFVALVELEHETDGGDWPHDDCWSSGRKIASSNIQGRHFLCFKLTFTLLISQLMLSSWSSGYICGENSHFLQNYYTKFASPI